MTKPASPNSTRQRLLAAGLRLFAEHGFDATTVGDIEAAAGLQPRRGAMYKHFRSKAALLEAAVRDHLESVREGREWILQLPRGDVRTEALMLGRFVLDELVAERAVVDVLEGHGNRVPELRDLFRERISDVAYRAMTDVIRRWLGREPGADTDLEALAVHLLGSLINVHRSAWTFGATPLGRTEDAMLAAWADLCVRLVDGLGRDLAASPGGAA